MIYEDFLLNPGLTLIVETLSFFVVCRIFHFLLFRNIRRHRRSGKLICIWLAVAYFSSSAIGIKNVGVTQRPGIEAGIFIGMLFGWVHAILDREFRRVRISIRRKRSQEGRFGLQGKRVVSEPLPELKYLNR